MRLRRWVLEWSMAWEWLTDDFMMWVKTDPSGSFAVAAVLNTSLLGPEASPWHHGYNWCHVFSISFPGGFAAQSRMLSPRWWLALQVLCMFEHAYSHYVYTRTVCQTGQKGGSSKILPQGCLLGVSDLCSAPQGFCSGRTVSLKSAHLCFQHLLLELGSLYSSFGFQWFSFFFRVICTEST